MTQGQQFQLNFEPGLTSRWPRWEDGHQCEGGQALSAYAEKLKDPRWQRKRLEILNRDNFTCRGCGSTEKTLHVHHLFYVRGAEPWAYRSSTLITFCVDCHEVAHDEQRSAIESLLHALHGFGATYADLINLAVAIDFCTPEPATKQVTAEQWTQIGKGIGALIATAYEGGDLAAIIEKIRS